MGRIQALRLEGVQGREWSRLVIRLIGLLHPARQCLKSGFSIRMMGRRLQILKSPNSECEKGCAGSLGLRFGCAFCLSTPHPTSSALHWLGLQKIKIKVKGRNLETLA